jgi:proliferating cell nuclear antigen PCNA
MSKKYNYIFKAKTREAFVVKILGELLNNTLSMSPFRINDKGIFLLQSDGKNHQMIDISLFRDKFNDYVCSRPINFNVNSSHLYRMLKNIRKKDGITLFITEPEKPSDPLKLGICVENDENNKVVTYIRITPTQLTTIDKPEEYENPIIMTSKEFQKMKTLHNLSQVMTVSYKPQYINFFCDAGELYSRSVSIGNNSSEDDIKTEKQYKQEYYTSYITSLTKCAGQSGIVQVYVHEDCGMKIKMNAGNIGDITVYIKSKEMIDSEENMNRPLDENEDDEYDEGVYVSRQQEEKNNYISELNEHENDNELSSKLNNMNIQENLKVKRVKKLN